MKKQILLVAIISLSLLNIITSFLKTLSSPLPLPKIHACLRTKNSLKYMDELLSYHHRQGITSFDIYDDSDDDNLFFFNKYPYVTYHHVGGLPIPNENYYIWECMTSKLTWRH